MKVVTAHRLATVSLVALLFAAAQPLPAANLGDAQWIWSPAHRKGASPTGSCYFRKTIRCNFPQDAQIEITADDAYELYVNGEKIGEGQNWRRLDRYDISRFVTSGRNSIAVKVANHELGPAALVARIVVVEQDGNRVTHISDASWKTSLREVRYWNKSAFLDFPWVRAQSYGAFAATLPWGNETRVTGARGRFQITPQFRVDQAVAHDATGSLIAMAFNENGEIIASRENGPLLLISDRDQDGVPEHVATYCKEVKNCQGLLPLNDQVFVVGDGPDGAAMYRLEDDDRDGKIDKVSTVLRFKGAMGEHGAHALRLGPDGLIYIVVGNHSSPEDDYAENSPYRNAYEGDLVQPRYEDPGGHAAGIKAPGGVILRTNLDGSHVECFAGGLRNPYDIAFNRQGELFTYDSDMESNMGLPWYRPTRLNHLTPGAELGWRSGWAKWPEYYPDGLPATRNMGPGSPTGIVFYDHFRYPLRYHNAMFACDWASGRINVVRLGPDGGSYHAHAEIFLEGRPLNATDIAVGPDGWLYFCTGGRDTQGGIYVVSWTGELPSSVGKIGTGIERAIRQPQPRSAWARRRIGEVQDELGEQWARSLQQIARSTSRSTRHRLRALELLQLFGPEPSSALLLEVTRSAKPELRAKATYLIGLHSDEVTDRRLSELLTDRSGLVRRVACESLVRRGYTAPAERLVRLLADPDRYVAFAARRALERQPIDEWKTSLFELKRIRTFVHGSIAMLAGHPDKKIAGEILVRCFHMARGKVHDPDYPKGFISDEDFMGLLRVMQLALMLGKITPEEVPALTLELSEEYPSRNDRMNRELVRMLAFLQAPTAAERMIEQLEERVPDEEKLHAAIHAAFLKDGWTTELKLQLLLFYEDVRQEKSSRTLGRYIDAASRDFFENLTSRERQMVLDGGTRWPNSALALLARLPVDPGEETLLQLERLDRRLSGFDSEAVDRLRKGIVAVLGRSRDAEAMDYLREQFEDDPERRDEIAMGLAQEPAGKNWPLLIRVLPIIDGAAAAEVLRQLATADRWSRDPEPLRQVILCGLRSKPPEAALAVELLEHWIGEGQSTREDSPPEAVKKWQAWFAAEYPEHPAAKLPVESQKSNWTYDELLAFLTGKEGSRGDAKHGAVVFDQAECGKCHRFRNRGEHIGPDLTAIGRRFQTKEILQSIVFPSHVIPDRYLSKVVLTEDGRTYSGLVASAGEDGVVVLQSNGDQITVAQEDIDEMTTSTESAMPEGLLNPLTLQDIADLFAYFRQSAATNLSKRPSANERK